MITLLAFADDGRACVYIYDGHAYVWVRYGEHIEITDDQAQAQIQDRNMHRTFGENYASWQDMMHKLNTVNEYWNRYQKRQRQANQYNINKFGVAV